MPASDRFCFSVTDGRDPDFVALCHELDEFLNQLVGGEQAMDTILNNLFNRELDPMYPYLSYQDFLEACGLKEEDLNLA